MNFLLVYHYFIAFSFLVSLLIYKKRLPLYLKLMPPFLFLTLLTETYSSYLSTINKNNIPIYNFFSAFEFGFYLFLISLIIRNPKVKKLIRISIGLYWLAAVSNIIFVQGIKTFHTTSYAAGCLLVVAFCIYYFYEVFRFPSPGKLQYSPAFWICTALLFFYCCGFPMYGLMNLWIERLPLLYSSFGMITDILNSILYSLFTVAFLCTRSRNYILLSS
jgi:hypothetical protein